MLLVKKFHNNNNNNMWRYRGFFYEQVTHLKFKGILFDFAIQNIINILFSTN